MTDVLDRLKAALTDPYTIEREIGVVAWLSSMG